MLKTLTFRLSLGLGLSMLLSLLSACGGSGAGGSGSSSLLTSGSGGVAAALVLTSDAAGISSDGLTTTKLIGILRTAEGIAIKNPQISFATTDPGIIISPLSGTTTGTSTDNSIVQASIKVIDKTVRTVNFTALGNGFSAKLSLPITAGSTANSLVLTADSRTITSDGRKAVTVFATAKSADNVALAGVPVTFSTLDKGATIAASTASTDASGIVQASVTITDKATRTFKVIATSAGLSSTIDLSVVGTTVSISGPTALGFGATADYTVVAKDAAGTPISDQAVILTTANQIIAQPSVTDAQGQAKFKLTGSVSGPDIVKVVVLGSSTSLNLSVTSKQLTFDTPAANAEFLVGAVASSIVVKYLDAALPQAGKTVLVSATRGTTVNASGVPQNSFTTDAAGKVSFGIISTTAGFTTVSATVDTVTVSSNFEFVAKVPTIISVQGGPSVVSANLSAAGSATSRNSAQIIARVTDGVNPVKNQKVLFTALADDSNGTIEPPYAYTDSFGQATTSFYPGAVPTGIDKVRIQASIEGVPSVPVAETKLTVAKPEVFIRFGGANALTDTDKVRYTQLYTILVTDNGGRPVPDAKVVVTMQPLAYYKGYWVSVSPPPSSGSTTNFWGLSPTAVCPSEDFNRNGLLDPGEDTNANAFMEPGNVATVILVPRIGATSNDRTGSDGFANFELAYPKVYANAVDIEITVSILAPWGTEYKQKLSTQLLAVVDDTNDLTKAPPGLASVKPIPPSAIPAPTNYYISPFGYGSSCSLAY